MRGYFEAKFKDEEAFEYMVTTVGLKHIGSPLDRTSGREEGQGRAPNELHSTGCEGCKRDELSRYEKLYTPKDKVRPE